MIEAAGGSHLYLPPYSPDCNSVEHAFSNLKAHLRKAAERTNHDLWNATGRILDLYSLAKCANFFKLRLRCRLLEHWPSERTPTEIQVAALDELTGRGLASTPPSCHEQLAALGGGQQ